MCRADCLCFEIISQLCLSCVQASCSRGFRLFVPQENPKKQAGVSFLSCAPRCWRPGRCCVESEPEPGPAAPASRARAPSVCCQPGCVLIMSFASLTAKAKAAQVRDDYVNGGPNTNVTQNINKRSCPDRKLRDGCLGTCERGGGGNTRSSRNECAEDRRGFAKKIKKKAEGKLWGDGSKLYTQTSPYRGCSQWK